MQTHWQSFKEAVSNTWIGYVISLLSYFFIFDIAVSTTMIMTTYFTGVSLLRGYLIRRYFNKKGGE